LIGILVLFAGYLTCSLLV